MRRRAGHPFPVVSARPTSPPDPFRVLFLCTHNSARSQIAEAVLRKRAGDRFEVASAGSQPGGSVHALALRIIEDLGGYQKLHRTKGFEEVFKREWDLVITVCDQAQEACPALPSATLSAHWGVADPSKVKGSEEQRLAAFRAAQQNLTKRIDLFLSLDPGRIERSVLKCRLGRVTA
jgi:arsenate reductase